MSAHATKTAHRYPCYYVPFCSCGWTGHSWHASQEDARKAARIHKRVTAPDFPAPTMRPGWELLPDSPWPPHGARSKRQVGAFTLFAKWDHYCSGLYEWEVRRPSYPIAPWTHGSAGVWYDATAAERPEECSLTLDGAQEQAETWLLAYVEAEQQALFEVVATLRARSCTAPKAAALAHEGSAP